MADPRLTAAEAATQIVGLINSRPVSPWPHEIEAIIARVSPALPATSTLPDDVVAYYDRAREFLRQCKVVGPMRDTDPNYKAEYQRSTDLSNRVDEIADVILETPAETRGDLVGLASIILHETGHDLDAIGEPRVHDSDPGDTAAERLALAILRLHGMAIPQLVPVDFELVRLIKRLASSRTRSRRLPRRSWAMRRTRPAISQSKSGNVQRQRRGAGAPSTR